MNILSNYDPSLHLSHIQQWYLDWGMTPPLTDILPSFGIIMENICAVFLYETNSKVCFIESLITNPRIDKQIRNECLDHVIDVLLKGAKDKGYKYAYSYSKHQAVVDRAIKHGFTAQSDNFFCFGKVL